MIIDSNTYNPISQFKIPARNIKHASCNDDWLATSGEGQRFGDWSGHIVVHDLKNF